MPSHACCNNEIKQLYINGHFCYVYKFGHITNGLGIVRDISFYNKDFLKDHPEIIVAKKSDSLDDDKSLHDAKALVPILIDFFSKHPLINPRTGIPCCPTKPDLPMKYEGISKSKNALTHYKLVCPKVKWIKGAKRKYKRQCYCETPCTSSSCV